ncbi:MAG: succinate-semialdehyde dehydrogenase [Chitinophagaceae bacterium]|nr:succinate-semialdehyde dehydrogenase [Chitinophagaceae bacterium]
MKLSNTQLLQHLIFIDNKWVDSASNKFFDVNDPATGEKIISVADGGEADVLKAIEAASAAFEIWKSKTPKERSGLMKKWFTLIIENIDDLALLLTTEQGKPLAEAKGEIQYGASFIEWYAEECRRVYGEVIPSPVNDRRFITIKQPIGVVGAITPWNFPVAMIARKIAPAMAAGCTIVLKPSEFTPLCALALAQLAMDAGIPAGVLNIVPTTDAKAIGKILTTHDAVKKISFTGSTQTGRLLMQQSASTVKKLSLELGGNAPVIIFEDADIDGAVKGTLASKYRNAGQTCVCANRIFLHSSISGEFIEKYTAAVKQLKVGNGTDHQTQIGPLINSKAIEKVEKLMKDALHKGARLVTGGKRNALGELFYEPTIIDNCNSGMQLSNEEIFGPVSAIFQFNSDEEVVEMANNTIYGLAAYFFTSHVNRAWKIAEALEYGMIGINEGIISFAEAPFGGLKQSGYGKEGSFYGIDEYVVTKYLCFGGMS